MRGWVVAAVTLLGCGRVGFDRLGDGDGGTGGDAGTPACARAQLPAGPTWWVAKTGLDSNDGSMGSPVATITQGITLATSGGGGAVVVLDGTYDAEPGDELIVDVAVPIFLFASTRYGARIPRILCLGCADLHVEGFEVTGSAVALLHTVGGNRVTFADNLLHDGGSAGIRITSATTMVTLRGNLIYDTTGTAIHINDAFDVTIENNVVFYSSATSNGNGVMWLETVGGATAHGNVIYRIRGDDTAYGVISLRGTSATTIENNVIAGSPDATAVYASVGFDFADGMAKVRHNTFVGPFPGAGFGLGVDTILAGAVFDLRNNIWASPGTLQPFTSGTAPAGTVQLLRNLYWNAPTGPFTAGGAPTLGDDAMAIVADPGLSFTLPPAPTWSPTSRTFAGGYTTICDARLGLVEALAKIPANSPAVGTADTAASPSVDIRGRRRPTPASIGAYEP